MRTATLGLAVLFASACGGPPSSTPSATPAASETTSAVVSRPHTPTPSRDAGACSVSTQAAESALRAVTGARSNWMVPAPEFPADVTCCVAVEMARSHSVADAWAGLAQLKSTPPAGAVDDVVQEGAACSLVALLWYADVGVNIQAAHSMAKVPEVLHPLALPFLLDSIDRVAVIVEGSEEATMHGLLHDAIFESMGILTGLVTAHRRGQDPTGLRAAIPVWRAAIDGRAADFIEDAKGRRVPIPADQRACSTDDECDAVKADCSNFRCIGVRAQSASTYGADLDCAGYTGVVGNYDCLPRFHIESPRCEAGRCSTRRTPK